MLSSLGDVVYVVDFEVLCCAAFDAFVSVALEGLFAEFFGGSSGWVLPHVCSPLCLTPVVSWWPAPCFAFIELEDWVAVRRVRPGG